MGVRLQGACLTLGLGLRVQGLGCRGFRVSGLGACHCVDGTIGHLEILLRLLQFT